MQHGRAMEFAESLRLSNGVRLPSIGFGCAGRLPQQTYERAIQAGYTLLDTAQATEWYDEAAVGNAILHTRKNRSLLFLTSKLHPRDLGYQATLDAFPTSLKRLRTNYLDAFLLHYPRCFGTLCAKGLPKGDWKQSWRALESLYDSGKVRAIGVSNFSPHELKQLLTWARTSPHVVQNWMDPLHQERTLRAMCKEHGIVFQAYSTLGTQHQTPFNPVLKHPVINDIAKELGRSEAQVVLRWALQRGVAIIPRASKTQHMRSNLDIRGFNLSEEQLTLIDALDGADPRRALPPPPPKNCPDQHQMCERWASDGECSTNPEFMHTTCAGSCDTCNQGRNEL